MRMTWWGQLCWPATLPVSHSATLVPPLCQSHTAWMRMTIWGQLCWQDDEGNTEWPLGKWKLKTLKRRTSCSVLQGYVKTFLETAITIQQYAFFKYFDALPPSEIGGGRILTSTVVWGLLQREHPLYFERCCSSASIIPLYCCSNASIILWTWSEHHQPLCQSAQSQFCNFVAFFVPKVTSNASFWNRFFPRIQTLIVEHRFLDHTWTVLTESFNTCMNFGF